MLTSFFTWINNIHKIPSPTIPFQHLFVGQTVSKPVDVPIYPPSPWAQQKETFPGSEDSTIQESSSDDLVFDLSEPEPSTEPEPSAKLQRRSKKQAKHVEEGETI